MRERRRAAPWARALGVGSRPARALAALPVLVLLLAGPASAVGQVDPGVLVSRDGTTWSDQIATPLFQPDLAWVPGDVRTSTLWVRNGASETADLEVVLSRPADAVSAPDALVSTSGGLPGQPWTVVEPGGPEQVVRVDDVEPGDSAVVTLRTSLDAAAPAGTVVDASALQVDVRSADVDPSATPTPAPTTTQTPAPTPTDDPSGAAGTDQGDRDGDRDGAVGEGWLSSAQLELAPIFLGFALILAVLVSRRRGTGRPPTPPTRRR